MTGTALTSVPLARRSMVASRPVPAALSGRLYRNVTALAGAVSVNSTYSPTASSVTASRPDASDGSVP